MRLYNTLTHAKEEFVPLQKGAVSLYHCGPTVYDYAHIGNFRAYMLADLLRRTFEHAGFQVKQVMNITDVGHLSSDADEGEDKMTLALKREGKALTLANMKALADKYTRYFKDDLKKLNIKEPHAMPRASEHIPVQIALIKRLEEKRLVYRTSDGLYFDTGAYPAYGAFGAVHHGDLEHARIGANKEKKNHRDFALWKLSSELGWDSPWGKGFPGWHIECSAMSVEELGESFDIHTGGVDHIGTHHTNEIAQSEAVTGKPLARFWLHNEFVLVDGEKMAKSKGNITTLKDIEEKGIDPLAYRYWLLTAHYRTPVNFTWEALEGAQTALHRLWETMSVRMSISETEMHDEPNKEYLRRFESLMEDDLNTPQAVALIHEMFKDDSLSVLEKKATLATIDTVLGIEDNRPHEYIPDEVTVLADKRDEARKNKDYGVADALRKKIEKKGYIVKDTPWGRRIDKK